MTHAHHRITRRCTHLLLWLAVFVWLLVFPAGAQAIDPAQGTPGGGPILVVTSAQSTHGTYYAEILRTEGFNAFHVADIGTVSASTLASYDVVILAKMPLTAGQVTTLSDWVNAGGNLIAMGPDSKLAGLLGLTAAAGTLADRYLLVDTAADPGNGIVGETMQFHGTADLYTLNGATALATLYSSATAATSNPALSVRAVGAGRAAAFAYDLATSIVYTRQGNPAWATQERDGFPPIRSDDKFYGAASADPRADWVDLDKVHIPQADEQQRLLANLILWMNSARKPLPRFWYFPNGKKAVVVMTGDDHGNGGTAGRFDLYKSLSPANCSVANWECIRATSYIYPSTPLSDAQAAQYTADGFEVGLHISTSCADYTLSSLQTTYDQQMASFQSTFPGAGALRTQRHHCIVWSDWSSAAQVQLSKGMRLDTSYYFWPPSWVGDEPGLFTGSAMPMRFTRPDGSLVDVYMAATQMTDESGQSYPMTAERLLDRVIGAQGFYGAYTVNAHTDLVDSDVSTAVVNAARARNVSIISAGQLLTWLDARGNSSFGALGFASGSLTFNVTKDPAANGLQGMLPMRSGTRVLGSLTRSGAPVTFTVSTIKGVEYALFAAESGSYAASYGVDSTGPLVTSTTPGAGATNVNVAASVTATFGEAMTASTINASTFELRTSTNAIVSATVSYDSSTRTATLKPLAALAGSSTYTATLRGGATDPRIKDAAGNALPANVSWSFTTASAPTGPNCPCSAWSSTTVPTTPQVADPNAVELGVKFRVDVDGFVTGIRFYKGASNTGTHIGSLWSAGGTRLGTATFVNETASGWQQVLFATPVAVTAGTVYVASYFAPNGNYAGDGNFFTSAGVDNGPVHLLQNGVSGGNGVYRYGATSGFPSQTWSSTNYWVDVVFTAGGGGPPGDTTPPTVTGTTPAQGTTGVPAGTSVTATFSEAMTASTVNGTTFELRTAANALVSATVAYNATSRVATLTPGAPLAAGAIYTATVRGGGTDPRVKDAAGNALAASLSWSFTIAAGTGGCAPAANPIVAENCLPGNAPAEWDISGVGDTSIQGFATDISVNRGSTVSFKVDTNATNYRFDIYRMGYYGGQGARKVATVNPSATLPQNQPNCLNDTTTGLIDCGNWAVSGSWAVPATATSGIYFAKVIRTDTNGASHIFFIVRDDASTSQLLFQTADTTWQAYNNYGGNSLYTGAPAGRAYKVSYNRPFFTRIVDDGQDWVFNAEYPMVRWLEANGYDVSYITGLDSERLRDANNVSLIQRHRVFLSVGHDEYWSGVQRANVTAARNAGVHLAFFSGNEVFWKTRWENSIDASNTPFRTLVSYKETHANQKIDPTPAWTGTWRDPRFSPPADGGRPENELTGTLFMVNGGATTSIMVPPADGKMRFWRNTPVAALAPTSPPATLPHGTLGYEWDVDPDNAARPAGLIRLSLTTVPDAPVLQDQGSTYASGTATHALTLYRHASGALVFGAGTVQWSWGLDATHARAGTPTDASMQQATVNLFADMGVQPATLRPGLVAATASTDTAAPSSTVTSPAAGATVAPLTTVTITGTAVDSGGGLVGGVEVSVDGGATWRRANGRENWSYSWRPVATGPVVIKSRATDDSGYIEAPGAGNAVTVGSAGPAICPCTIWPSSSAPVLASEADTASVNVGIKFRSDQDGYISGIRFYKGTGNTGTHIGALWTSGGTQLATATFTSETASGWQQVNFATPVPITANTVYVASYLAPSGHYAADDSAFASSGVDSPPLHALQNGVSGGNGVYAYGAGLLFPTQTFQSTNYWVDVVFSTTAPQDTTPPTVSGFTPASGATNVAVTAAPTATFSEAVDAQTVNASTFSLRDAVGAVVTGTVSYNATTRVATLTPGAPLATSTTYTATVRGGTADPRVKDSAGNALAANATWSFTTAAPDTTAPTVTAVTPAAGATGVARGVNVTATFSEDVDPATINGNTVFLRNPAGALIAAAVTYDATNRRVTLNPSANLAGLTTYTATVKGGSAEPRVKDRSGNALAADRVWTFQTRQ